jgi:hypothetical protein
MQCGEPEELGAVFNRRCEKQCKVNTCQCPEGKVQLGKKCVDGREECPVDACPGDLVRRECGSACPAMCGKGTAICTADCKVDVCQCPPGKIQLGKSKCVDECPAADEDADERHSKH